MKTQEPILRVLLLFRLFQTFNNKEKLQNVHWHLGYLVINILYVIHNLQWLIHKTYQEHPNSRILCEQEFQNFRKVCPTKHYFDSIYINPKAMYSNTQTKPSDRYVHLWNFIRAATEDNISSSSTPAESWQLDSIFSNIEPSIFWKEFRKEISKQALPSHDTGNTWRWHFIWHVSRDKIVI